MKKIKIAGGIAWKIKDGKRVPVEELDFDVVNDQLTFVDSSGVDRTIDLTYLASFIDSNVASDLTILPWSFATDDIQPTIMIPGIDLGSNTDLVKLEFFLDDVLVDTINIPSTEYTTFKASGYSYVDLTPSTLYVLKMTITDINGNTDTKSFSETTSDL